MVPIVEELQRRLPPINGNCKVQGEEEEQHGTGDDVVTGQENGM